MSWFEQLRLEALSSAASAAENAGASSAGEDAKTKQWLRFNVLSSSSPVRDVHVFATANQAFMLNEKKRLQPLLESRDGGDDDEVTSVACLPVLETTGSSSAQLLWHCAVVGFRSGHVEVVSDAGQTLLRRRFADTPVVRIRANTIHLRRNQYSSCLDPVFLPLLSDILVVYANMVALVLNEQLYLTMLDNRARLAEERAQRSQQEGGVGEAMREALANIKCKRMPIREQAVSDACIYTIKNTTFHMVSELSLNRAASPTSLSSLAEQTVVASVGSSPFVQFNTPYNYMHTQNINELAENVVSTVKSGLFRAATGYLWGGGGGSQESQSPYVTEEQRRRRDPEQKLTMTQAFKDPQRLGLTVEKSPNNLYFAVLDNQNRVLLFDAMLGTTVHVWKGYHHAQIGWINSTTVPVSDPDMSHSDLPRDMRVSCLLVVYLPKRGSIEVWSPEQKSRVAEFAVSKNGRLLLPYNCILDSLSGNLALKTRDVCFLDGDTGDIKRLVVPIRSVINLSSSAHDVLQEQKLAAVLQCVSDNFMEMISQLLKSSRTSSGKIKMLLDIIACPRVSADQVETLLDELDALDEEASEDRKRPQSLNNCISLLRNLLRLFEFLMGVSDESVPSFDGESIEDLKKALDCDDRAASKLTTLLGMFDEIEDKEMEVETAKRKMTFTELAACFAITPEMFERKAQTELSLTIALREGSESASQFVTLLCRACRLKKEDTVELLSKLGVKARNLLEVCLNSFVNWPRALVSSLASAQIDALQVCLELLLPDETKSSDVTMHFYFPAQRILNHSVFSPALYFTLWQWRRFLSSNPAYFERLVSEASHTLLAVESYLVTRLAYGELCRKQTRVPFDFYLRPEKDTVDSVFAAGNGRIAEIISQWLVDLKFIPKNLHHADSLDFTSAASAFFPKNAQFKTLVSHMAWEYLRRWSDDRGSLEHLRSALACLKSISHEAFARNLTILAYKTFLEKPVREAVNVTEIRSAHRCRREVGLAEEDLPSFLGVCVDHLRLLIDNDPGVEIEVDPGSKFYDDLSSKVRPHLLDHLGTVPTGTLGELLILQYQFALIAGLIWSYKIDVKPLKLFTNQESNMFFQGGGDQHSPSSASASSSSSISGFFTMTHNNLVTNYRAKFLELAEEEVVRDCLYLVPDDCGGTGRLEMAAYKERQSHLSLLGKMWYLSDKLKEYQVIALYKEGYDSLGEEVLSGVSDAAGVGIRLMHVAILRLTKHIYESEDHARKLAVIKPHLMTRFCQLQEEARELRVDSSLKRCKDLLVFLGGAGLDDDSAQIVFECLSLVQLFMKQEGTSKK